MAGEVRTGKKVKLFQCFQGRSNYNFLEKRNLFESNQKTFIPRISHDFILKVKAMVDWNYFNIKNQILISRLIKNLERNSMHQTKLKFDLKVCPQRHHLLEIPIMNKLRSQKHL